MRTFVQDPNEHLDYTIDWTEWLTGDTIASALWTADDGLTIDATAVAATTLTIAWLMGGTLGQSYVVTCQITTTQGRIKENAFRVSIKSVESVATS